MATNTFSCYVFIAPNTSPDKAYRRVRYTLSGVVPHHLRHLIHQGPLEVSVQRDVVIPRSWGEVVYDIYHVRWTPPVDGAVPLPMDPPAPYRAVRAIESWEWVGGIRPYVITMQPRAKYL